MLATARFELLLTPNGRQELDALAADLGVSAADAVRLALAGWRLRIGARPSALRRPCLLPCRPRRRLSPP